MIARVCSLAPPKESVDAWENLGKQFSEALIARYTPEKFTPYMHVFVAHVGFFLKEYGEIESMANYDIETKNADNKAFVNRGSNRFGGLSNRSTVTAQQLHREHRMEQLGVLLQPEKTVSKKRKIEKGINDKKAKRRRVESNADQVKTKRQNWTSKVIEVTNNPTFEAAQLIALAETNEKMLQDVLGFDFGAKVAIPDAQPPPIENFNFDIFKPYQ